MKDLVSAALLMGLTVCAVPAGETGKAEGTPANGATVILDTGSFWRCHITLRPSLWGTAAKPQPRDPQSIPRVAPKVREFDGQRGDGRRSLPVLSPGQPFTPAPPKDWAGADFDDSSWWRTQCPVFGGGGVQLYGMHNGTIYSYGNPAYDVGPKDAALLCFRGKFRATDPQKANGLRLSLAYRGGAVVYLNGTEIARSHMPAGAIAPETLAEDYPDEAFAVSNDAIAAGLNFRGHPPKSDKEKLQAEQAEPQIKKADTRVRRMENSEVPAKLLRKGINVLAIEIHRAAMRKECPFQTCALAEVKLTGGGEGLEPNVARPKGLQVWPADVMEDVLNTDHGDPAERVGPVRIVGTRNGAFSGQVVVSSDAPIKGLKVEVGDLVHKDGKARLPASAVRLMYGYQMGSGSHQLQRLRGEAADRVTPNKYMGLSEKCPAEVALTQYRWTSRSIPNKTEGVWIGPVQPVWATVSIPADAVEGEYGGKLAIRAEGSGTIEVPLLVKVCGWKLPEGRDYQTFVDIIESPESVAIYYGAKLWSDEHFKLLDKSFELLGSVGNKTVYLPLAATLHLGNEETMVRWIKKADGTWGHDFTVMEKYLDAHEKRCGKPRVLYLCVYDFFLGAVGSEHHGGDWAQIQSITGYKGGKVPDQGQGPPPPPVPVTVLDAPGGTARMGEAPAYTDAAAEKAWKPLADELMKRLKTRGMDKAVLLAFSGDLAPPKPYLEFWAKMLPGVKWASHSHEFAGKLYGQEVIGLTTSANMVEVGIDPAQERYYGWNVPEGGIIWTLFPRYNNPSSWTRAYYRVLEEMVITGRSAGVSRLTGDFFHRRNNEDPVERKKPLPVFHRYPRGWGNMGLKADPWLLPGEQGAVAGVPFDLFREGVQECQARIFVEKALLDPGSKARLGDDLARRAQEMLDERTRSLLWIYCQNYLMLGGRVNSVLRDAPLLPGSFAGSGWQERNEQLFAAAAEAQKALGEK